MTRMMAKEAICSAIESQGIQYVFGNPGTTEVPFLDALTRFPSIRYVLALHESVATAMADGYGRVSGRPGVANVHTTGGLANTLGMMFNAARDGSPLLVLAGQQFTDSLLREPMLASDLCQLTQQFAKWSYQVNRSADIPLAMARALKTCMQPPRGPVFVALPRDLLEEEVEAGEWPASSPGIPYRQRGDLGQIEQAARLLSEARSPVVLAGPGVLAASATEELKALAETCALRVYTSPGVLPADYPLRCGGWRPMRQGLKGPLENADLALVVGSPMFREFPPVAAVSPDLRFIHVDADPWEIGKNFPTSLGIVADPKAALEDLASAAEARIGNGARRESLQKRRQSIEAANTAARAARVEELRALWDNQPASAARLVGEMGRVLDPGALIVEEALRSATYLDRFYPFATTGAYLTSEAGCLGWGLGAALGAKLAEPQRQVVAFLGDGSTCYQLQALWTAARYQIAVPIIVCRNGVYMAVKSALSLYGGQCCEQSDYYCTDLGGIDFVGLAASLGVEGRRVERPDDIRASLEWSLAQNRPTLLEVLVDPKDAGYGVPRVA